MPKAYCDSLHGYGIVISKLEVVLDSSIVGAAHPGRVPKVANGMQRTLGMY